MPACNWVRCCEVVGVRSIANVKTEKYQACKYLKVRKTKDRGKVAGCSLQKRVLVVNGADVRSEGNKPQRKCGPEYDFLNL